MILCYFCRDFVGLHVRKCACVHIDTCSLLSCHPPPSCLRLTSLVLLLPELSWRNLRQLTMPPKVVMGQRGNCSVAVGSTHPANVAAAKKKAAATTIGGEAAVLTRTSRPVTQSPWQAQESPSRSLLLCASLLHQLLRPWQRLRLVCPFRS